MMSYITYLSLSCREEGGRKRWTLFLTLSWISEPERCQRKHLKQKLFAFHYFTTPSLNQTPHFYQFLNDEFSSPARRTPRRVFFGEGRGKKGQIFRLGNGGTFGNVDFFWLGEFWCVWVEDEREYCHDVSFFFFLLSFDHSYVGCALVHAVHIFRFFGAYNRVLGMDGRDGRNECMEYRVEETKVVSCYQIYLVSTISA